MTKGDGRVYGMGIMKRVMDYLATWNCSHIANGATIARLLEFNRAQGLCECVICTLEELMEGES